MTKTGAERIKKYRARLKASGFTEVKVKVPTPLIEKLQAYAKKLCASVTK